MAIRTVTSTADSGAGSLRATIAAAQSGDTIQFASTLANKTIALTSGELSIPTGKNLTIDGGAASGLTISGNNASRIFLLNSTSATPTSLTVKNLTLANGRTTDRGGAISTTHQGVLTVENVSFNNNVADKGGGAIFSAFEGTLTVTGSRFNGNKATAGNDERGAGAIAFWGPRNFIVRNSEFVGNQGINGGAINSLNGKLTIENSKFINNSTIAGTFANGQPNPFLRGFGGAVFTDRASSTSEASGTIRIANSTFQGNQGRGEGGAAYLYTGTQDTVIIEGTSFNGNTVQALPGGGNGGNGGALVVLSNGLNKGLSISRSSFVNNTASSQGGGLWMQDAPATIVNSTFSGNKTTGTDYNRVGGGMALYGPANIVNSTIANNKAGWVGGGISASDKAAVNVKNTIFYNNTADNGTNNWGIQQHTSRELTDQGGNIQFPAKKTNNWNDYNATAQVRIVDPKLGALQDNGGGLLTHALLTGSPAINTGIGSGAPTVDARNLTRDGQVDVGAIEFGVSGSNVSPPPPPPSGTPGTITGTSGADTLIGTSGKNTILAGGGNDSLTGGLEADVLTGGAGADRFLYRGTSRLAAFSQSRVGAPDRITDFNTAQSDRIQFDYDNKLSTSDKPTALFNAGKLSGATLSDAVKLAYADKNYKSTGKQALAANEAVFFSWKDRTYLSANNSNATFSTTNDLVIDMAAAKVPAVGALTVNTYFQ